MPMITRMTTSYCFYKDCIGSFAIGKAVVVTPSYSSRQGSASSSRGGETPHF